MEHRESNHFAPPREKNTTSKLTRLAYRLFGNRLLNRALVFLVDALISLTASFLVISLLYLFRPYTYSHEFFIGFLGFALLASAVIFALTKVYKGIIRLSGFREVFIILRACALKASVLGIFTFVCLEKSLLAPGIMLADMLFTFAGLTSARALVINLYRRIKGVSGVPALMYISRINADMDVYPDYRLGHGRKLSIVAYISAENVPKNFRIEGKTINPVSNAAELSGLLEKSDVRALVFADERDFRAFNPGCVEVCLQHKVELLVQRPPEGPDREKKSAPGLREVRIEDLLSREEITVDMPSIRSDIADRVVLVTGAAGSIGSELARQLSGMKPKQLILLDFAESPLHDLRLQLETRFPDKDITCIIGDIRSGKRLDFVFRTYRPDLVFHAAAYKHVPLMEENPCEAILSIVRGSRQVADFCVKYDVEKMVMVSTDKAVNPSSVMGASKRIAEMYVQGLDAAIKAGTHKGKTRFVTTRFGNVLGSNGSVIPLFKEQIRKGGPVTVTHPDIERYFMTIPEACRLVLEAGMMGKGGEIFVFDMGKAVKINEMACRMIRLAGLEPGKDISIVYSGLRPGEKLYEELLSNEENTIPTNIKKVLLAKVRDVDYSHVCTMIDGLEALSEEVNVTETVACMLSLVPEYQPLNSHFGTLSSTPETIINA